MNFNVIPSSSRNDGFVKKNNTQRAKHKVNRSDLPLQNRFIDTFKDGFAGFNSDSSDDDSSKSLDSSSSEDEEDNGPKLVTAGNLLDNMFTTSRNSVQPEIQRPLSPPLKKQRLTTSASSSSPTSNSSLFNGDATVEEKQTLSWVEKYAPTSVEQVALHSMKKKEVVETLMQIASGKSPIRLLILSGPAGTSKSTIVKTAFKEVYQRIQRAKQTLPNNNSQYPIRQQAQPEISNEPKFIEWVTPELTMGKSLPMEFRNFLVGSKFQGNYSDCLVLIEDLPNVSHHATREVFNRSLLEWLDNSSSTSKYPCIVIIVTEVEVSSGNEGYSSGFMTGYTNPASVITERIFDSSILALNKTVKRIKFNKVAKSICAKSLKYIAEQEAKEQIQIIQSNRKNKRPITKSVWQKIPPGLLKNIIDTLSQYGDIRSSINTFEYLIKSSSTSANVSSSIKFGLDLMKRDNQVDLFHTAGKVLYVSMKDRSGVEISDEDQVVQAIVDDWGVSSRGDQQSLEGVLFENYIFQTTNLLTITRSMEVLELGNVISSLSNSKSFGANSINFSENSAGGMVVTEVASQLEVRGLRLAMKNKPSHSSRSSRSSAMRFPKFMKKKEAQTVELEQELKSLKFESLVDRRNPTDIESLTTFEKYYMDIIPTLHETKRIDKKDDNNTVMAAKNNTEQVSIIEAPSKETKKESKMSLDEMLDDDDFFESIELSLL